MRSAYLFAMIAGAGSVAASAIAFAVDLPVYPITIAYAGGVVVSIAASVVVNTRNANRYGRHIWEESQHSDFDEPVVGSHRVRVRRGRGRGVHEASFSGLEG